MVRGRTITLSALSLLAIYTLFSREPQSAAGSQQAPAIPAGADDDDPAPDDGDPLTDGEAEVLAALNSTELRERLSRRKFRRKLQPMSWRHNRKKMTELTSITSVKDPNAKPPAEPESPEGQESAGPAKPSTLQWLADSWSGGQQFDQRRDAAAAARQAAALSDEARAERRRRWMAHGAVELCHRLRRAHNVVPGGTWGTLPPNQKRIWQTLRCDTVAADGEAPKAGMAAAAKQAAAPAPQAAAAAAQPAGGARGEDAAMTPEDECSEMAEAHGVLPGQGWGSLPEALKMRWNQLACDRMGEVLRRRRRDAGTARRQKPVDLPKRRAVDQAAVVRHVGYAHKSGNRLHLGGSGNTNPCREMQIQHNVRVGASWGTLPPALQQRWTTLDCDRRVA